VYRPHKVERVTEEGTTPTYPFASGRGQGRRKGKKNRWTNPTKTRTWVALKEHSPWGVGGNIRIGWYTWRCSKGRRPIFRECRRPVELEEGLVQKKKKRG